MSAPLQPQRDADDPLTGNADYDALPRAIREAHHFDGWQWLSETEKGRLVETETQPDYTE